MKRATVPITIITPTYNAAKFLRETIETVLAQDYPLLDYIVVNDGSTDDTAELLAEYRGRLRVIHQANAGEQAAVNAGVALAKNDIVGIVNADDPVRAGLLAAVGEAFAGQPDLVGVYPDWIMLDAAGREKRRVRTCEYDFGAMLDMHHCIPGPGTFFRRSALGDEPVRDARLRYSGDFYLWLRLGLKGPMRRLPGYLATWRQHPQGASATKGLAIATDKLKVVEFFFARPDLPEHIRVRKRQALSAAYYRAALHAINNPTLPGRRWLMRSYLLKPIWPFRADQCFRRSIIRAAAVIAKPLSTWSYHELVGRHDG